MRQCDVSDTERTIEPQATKTVAYLVQSFDPNHAGDSTAAENLQHLGGVLGEGEVGGVHLYHEMYEVDLLQGLFDCFEV